MEQQKRYMTISELEKIGYSRKWLEEKVHVKDFPAEKDKSKKTSPWRIDILALEKWKLKHKIKKPLAVTSDFN